MTEACWTCGNEGREDGAGRVLCGRCRLRMMANPDISGSGHAPEWYVTHCWHCQEADVDPEDDLGLCGECKLALRTVPA